MLCKSLTECRWNSRNPTVKTELIASSLLPLNPVPALKVFLQFHLKLSAVWTSLVYGRWSCDSNRSTQLPGQSAALTKLTPAVKGPSNARFQQPRTREKGRGTAGGMFPFHLPQGFSFQPAPIPQLAMPMPSVFHSNFQPPMPMPQAFPRMMFSPRGAGPGPLMQQPLMYKGRGRGSWSRQTQGYPVNSGGFNRQRNKNKRKYDGDEHDSNPYMKVGRFQSNDPSKRSESGGLNSPQSSLNSIMSTSMHTKLVNGAKPIVHFPGDPCERITEAIVQYYNDFHQTGEDLRHKIVLSNCLYAIVRDIFPGCRLFIVGSSLSGFGTKTSDMDLCLLVSQIQTIDQKHEALHILNAIHRSLMCCTFVKSSQVIKAKVPILKFTDSKKNIECDLNINNGVGIRNTHLLKYYCLVDNRVAPLMLFIKFWARFHDINDAHKRTISSYTLALMLIHYLQVCKPPVLPCLQMENPEMFDQRVDLRELRLDQSVPRVKSTNTDSLGTLFQGFLDYYSETFRPQQEVISVREGCVLRKDLVQRRSPEPHSWKCLCVEEPFDRSNTARSVFDLNIFQRVRQVFCRSAAELRKEGDISAILSQPF